MEPARFSKEDNEPIYYSPNYPTFTQNNLETTRKKSHITLLEELQRLSEIYRNTILTDKHNVKSLYDVVKTTMFSYYHSNPKGYKNILDAGLIPEADPGSYKANLVNS